MNLIEGIQAECNRIRDEAIPAYSSPLLKGAGTFAITMMRADITMGEQAIASGDVVLMLNRLRSLAAWLNQRSAWDAALKTQMALVQAAEILGAGDVDLGESYP